MANPKINFLFANTVGDTFAHVNGQVWGWTEQYISNNTDLALAIAEAQEMAGWRQGLLGNNSVLQYIRIQDEGPPKTSRLIRWFASGPSANGDTDIPNTCVLIRCNTLAGPQRSYFLRGIPDQFIAEGGGFFPSPDYTSALNSYFNRLCGVGIAIARGGTLIQSLGTERQVLTVTQLAGVPQAVIEPQSVVDFAIGSFCNIKGARAAGAPQVRGLHKVVGKDTTTITINMPQVINPPYDTVAKGLKAFPVARVFSKYTGFAVKNSTHRITGRPFGLARGRKPKRV